MDGKSRRLIKALPLRTIGNSCSRRETSAVLELTPMLELPPRLRAGRKQWMLMMGAGRIRKNGRKTDPMFLP